MELGLSLSLSRLGGGPAPLNPITINLLAAMDTQPSAEWRARYDAAVVALSESTYWEALDAFYCLAGHDHQASRLYWKSPGDNTLTVNGDIVHVPGEGSYFNGSNTWYSNLPAVSGLQNDIAFGTYCTSEVAEAGVAFGTNKVASPAAAAFIRPRNASNVFQATSNTTNADTVAVDSSIGAFAVTRGAAGASKMYVNDNEPVAKSLTSTGLADTAWEIGRRGGSNDNYFSGRVAFAWRANRALTDAEILHLHGVMADFLDMTTYTTADFTYPSTIDASEFPAMTARVAYNPQVQGGPVIVLNHSWGTSFDYYGSNDLAFLVGYGAFVVVPGLRGRPSTDDRDASGREIQDALDALAEVRARYSQHASQTKAVTGGVSGGGGNALVLMLRAPDAFMGGFVFAGMGDYAAWHGVAPSPYPGQIETAVGGTPAAVPAKYDARNATEGLPINYLGGTIHVRHDVDDPTVPIAIARALDTSFTNASNARLNYSEVSLSPDHPSSLANAPLRAALKTMFHQVIGGGQEPWSVSETGTMTVRGWLKTKRFEILAGNLDDHELTVTYDTTTGSYTLTPETGEVTVTVTQGELTATETIDSETEIVLS
jgi:pimeloyl-ACP methyl ester carboxylesterase